MAQSWENRKCQFITITILDGLQRNYPTVGGMLHEEICVHIFLHPSIGCLYPLKNSNFFPHSEQ